MNGAAFAAGMHGAAVHPSPLAGIAALDHLHAMHFERIDKRTIALRDAEGAELGRLHRPSIWKQRWELMITGEGLYTIKANGGLGMGHVLVFIGTDGYATPMLELRYTLSGRLHFRMPGQKEPFLILRRPSLWKQRYVLEDASGNTMATIVVKQRLFAPREFMVEEWGDPMPDARQLLLAVHGIGTMLDRAAAAAAT